MDEYIKREDALDAVLFALAGTGHQSKAILAIREVPTSAIAEELAETKMNWLKIRDSYNADCIAHYNKGRSDAAEEIIDELFKILDAEYRQYDTETLSDTLNKMYMSSRNTVNKITAELVELKEKYKVKEVSTCQELN